MKPSQIITGSANSNPLTFTYTIYEDDVYYSYSSGSNVYILKGVSLKVIQVLTGHQSDVTCVSWLSNDTKLLTSSQNEIFLYILNKEKSLWEHVFTIPNQFEIISLAWLQPNSFIVGGHSQIVKWKIDQQAILKNYQINKGTTSSTTMNNTGSNKDNLATSSSSSINDLEFSSTTTTNKHNLTSSGNNTPVSGFGQSQVRVTNEKFLLDQKLKEQKIFNKQAQIVWRTDCSSPISNLSCSPDGSLFATCGKFDRMIKVWFLQKKSKAKLLAEQQQIKLQQEQLSLLQQREELAKQKNNKGFYKEQFNKLTNKGPVYKASKIGIDEVVSSGGIASVEDSDNINSELDRRSRLQKQQQAAAGAGTSLDSSSKAKPTDQQQDDKMSIQELQKQLNSLQELYNKQKNKKFEGESYGFIYLPHPRSITWISWRNRKTSTHNILLTNCKDGVVRLWQQSPQSRRLQFNVSNIIPSGSDVVDWVYSQNEDKIDIFKKSKDGSSNNSSDNNNEDDEYDEIDNNSNNKGKSSSSSTTAAAGTATSNDSNDTDTDSNNSYLRSHDFKLHLTNPILLRQKDSLAKTNQIVDWIIGIKSDGSLVLWKLRTDDSMTKQTSSISIWINSQILSPQEIGPNRIISLYQPMSLTDNTPGSIKVCFNSFNGAISSRRFYIQNQNQTRITNASPVSRCYGHKSTIKKLATSQNSPYLSSLDYQNNVIIWNSTDSSKIQSPNYLIDIGSFPHYYSMSWSPNQKFCFFSNRDGIFVYYIEVSPENHIKSSLLSIGMIEESTLEDDWIDEVHIVDPINLIYWYSPMDGGVNSGGSHHNQNSIFLPYQYFLIGLNKHSDKLYVWGVSIEKDFKYSSSSSPSILKSKLLATKEFERDSRLSCICAAPKGIFDSTTFNKRSNSSNSKHSSSDSETSSDEEDDDEEEKEKEEEDRSILTQPICITGSIEGYISVLGITPKVSLLKSIDENTGKTTTSVQFDDWVIGEIAGYHAYQQPVESVKAAYFGRFASKAFSTNFNPEIHIWELESHTPKLRLEDTIKFYLESELIQLANSPPQQQQFVVLSPTSGTAIAMRSPPITTTISLNTSTSTLAHEDLISSSFSFVSLDDGSYSLAFGFGNQIKILNKPVDRVIGSYKRPWVQTHNYDDLTSPCSSLEWGKDLSLYVSAGNQIMVFTKWIKLNNITDGLALAQFSSTGDYNTKLNSIYHQHSELQRPLPMYHPKFLTEYMMAGKFGVVEKILKHMCQYLFEKYSDLDPTDLPKTPIFIPPLPIEEIIHFDELDPSATNSKKAGTSDDMDKMNSMDYKITGDKDDDDDDDDEDNSDRDDDRNQLNKNGKFSKKQARKLTEILSSIRLGSLTNSEQIQLLAVTDTYGEIGEMSGGLDENGSRFLMAAKVFQFLSRSLPPQDRPISLSTADILWALHSEAQETILSSIFPTDPDWDALKQIGAGLWIKSPSTLRNVIDKLAKTTYINKRDPRECSLFYLALGKKGALVALHRASKDTKQVEFLSQDFTQAKWITAANKSAFLLQSKHKYELAASLFLLAGQLKKAVNLIIQMQGDFQLALVISRLFEGEGGEVSRMIIEDHVIPHAKKTNDRSLLSIGNWLLKKYEDAIQVLIPSFSIDTDHKLDENIDVGVGFNLHASGSSTPHMSSRNSMVSSPINRSITGISTISNATTNMTTTVSPISQQLRASQLGPSALYFFRFLKNHVQLRQLPEEKKREDEFLRNSSYSYFNSGCSLLALENIEKLEASHPIILTDQQERIEFERLEKLKLEKEKLELQQKQQQQQSSSNYMGLDFGGSSSNNNGFFSKPSYDMGLDFGGGGSNSSSGFFSKPSGGLDGLDFGGAPSKPSSSSSYMGLDFNTPSEPTKPSSDLGGLDFGAPTKSSSSSYMGLDFNSPSEPTKPSNDLGGLDFGAPSKPTSSSSYMGLDFNTPSEPTKPSSSSYMGLDFNTPTEPTKPSNDLGGLDFGAPSKPSSSSSYMGLDFNTPSESTKPTSSGYMGLDFNEPSKPSSSNYMGLDFNTPSESSKPSSSSSYMGLDFNTPTASTTTTTSNNWDFLDSKPKEESIKESEEEESNKNKEEESNKIAKQLSSTNETTNKSTFTPSKKEKLSLYPLVDNELKSKLVIKVLIETIMENREVGNWDEKFKEFKESLSYLCKKNRLIESQVIKELIGYCLNRQYIYQVSQLSKLVSSGNGDEKSIDLLEIVSTSIIKSLLRFDDDNILMLLNSSASQPLMSVSLEIYQSIMSLDTRYHNHSLILSTVYMMLFLFGYGSHRFDVLLVIFNSFTKSNQHQPLLFQQFINNIKELPIRNYKDTENEELYHLQDKDDSDDDDDDGMDDDHLNEKEQKKIQQEIKIVHKFLKRLFDFLSLKYFKQCFELLVKLLPYHQVFDSVNQRLSLWIGSSQSKLLIVPHKILDEFIKNNQKSTIENFLEILKLHKEFNTTDQYKIWNLLINNQKELLDHIILGIEMVSVQDPNSSGNPQASVTGLSSSINKANKNNDVPVTLKKVGSQIQFSSGSGKIKFEEEIELYKDGDLLQSFCLDPTSPELNVMAIATTRGIREIDHKQLVSEARDEYDIDPSENLSSPSSRKPRITGKSASSLNISGKSKISTVFNGLRSSKQVDHNIIVQCLESHPNSSFYLSGGIDGSVCLWQFGIPEVLTAYQLPQKPRIVRCKFNQSGTKFGACDMAGNILLWQFAAQEDTLKPFYSLQAHSKQCLDFTFLNSGSLLATAGISNDSKRDICLWDVLLPPNKSLIASYTDQENGAASIVYSPKRQTIIVGGKKGSLSLYDIRTHKQLDSFKAHHLNTKSLALDPFEEFVCSGSSDGNIKVWSLPSLTCLNTFEDAHKKQTFVRPTGVFKSPVSTYGVMQVRLENNNLFSCGSDGRLIKRKFYKF